LEDEMNERPRKATRLTVSLHEQDYRTLNEIALARDASVSWVIRQAIRQLIDGPAMATRQLAASAHATKPDEER
jgi:predicted transcriptional regulator